MAKERLPQIVAPLGGGTGITSDHRLVSGVTGRGRALSLSDGMVAMPARRNTGATAPMTAMRPAVPSVPFWNALPPLVSSCAAYYAWSGDLERYEYDDIDLYAIVVTTDGNRLEPETFRRYYYPNQVDYALWLNFDSDGYRIYPASDTHDVPFSYNERYLIRPENLPEIVAKVYIGASVWGSTWQDSEHLSLQAAHHSSLIIRNSHAISLIWGELEGYEAELSVPSSRTAIAGYFDLPTNTWVTEVSYTGNSTMLSYLNTRWPL